VFLTLKDKDQQIVDLLQKNAKYYSALGVKCRDNLESKASFIRPWILWYWEKSQICISYIANLDKNKFFIADFSRKKKAQEISSTNMKPSTHQHIYDYALSISSGSPLALSDFN
jgi:hypothetical protein